MNSILQAQLNRVTGLPEITTSFLSKNAKNFVTALVNMHAEIIASVKNAVHNEYPRWLEEISEDFIISYVNAAIRAKCKVIAPKQMKYLSAEINSEMEDLKQEHEKEIKAYTQEFIKHYKDWIKLHFDVAEIEIFEEFERK